MSRAAAADVIVEKPQNNIYTVLVIAATVAQLIAFLAIYSKAGEIFAESKGLFG
jgi:hypothetical protein